MRNPRNPFRLRAAENIESDYDFLRLFGPVMLDVIPGAEAWQGVHFLRSAAGSGRTALMRLFTPTAALVLHAQRAVDDYKELYQSMHELGVVGDEGPRLLGVMLPCGRTYATLADLDCDDAKRTRLLFALLDARILLAALRAAVTLAPAGLSWRLGKAASRSCDGDRRSIRAACTVYRRRSPRVGYAAGGIGL